MSYNIPTPDDIKKRVEAEAALSTGTQRAALSGTPENMVTRIVTIMIYEIYSFIAFLAAQILPNTATSAFLEQHASFWLAENRKPAAPATGAITVTGTAATIIPAGARMRRDDGQIYITAADITIDGGGEGTGTVTAEEPGIAGNTPPAIELALSETIIGIESIVTGPDGLSGGADVETDDGLRGRIKDRVQTPPRGGALHDYTVWAKQVPGVTRAWAKESEDGVVTVHVTFVMDNKSDGPIPAAGEVDAVTDHIESVRPVGSRPDIAAPVAVPVDLEIELMPNTVAVQQAIKNELESFFLREGSAGGVTLHLSRISETISVATGEKFHTLIEPAASLSFDFGELPVLGEITWSAPS